MRSSLGRRLISVGVAVALMAPGGAALAKHVARDVAIAGGAAYAYHHHKKHKAEKAALKQQKAQQH